MVRIRCTTRQKERLRKFVLLIIGGFLFITWSKEGTKSYTVVERPFDPGFHEVPDYNVKRVGPGEDGLPVQLNEEEKQISEEQLKKDFMSVISSDKVSLDRSIPDSRSQECRNLKYDSLYRNPPTLSVVIIFTNEFFSSLLRTVHSVVNRTPRGWLKEIILVDDVSDREELGSKLEDHLKRFGSIVKLFRSKERLGLIRAKIFGAKQASGEILVFLDAHCECNAEWAQPLVARIRENRKAVVLPVIDVISDQNMAYLGGQHGGIGTFWWSLHYSIGPIPKQEIARRKNPETDFIRSPTMPGGLFAANREYWFEIGAYDEEMDIWGGENLEISFRVWMCGGSIETLPCSHIGHIYRAGHPYNMTGRNHNLDVHGTNSKRLAEVWMDDYKRFFYMQRMGLKDDTTFGDVSARKELRARLQCHSFKWYLENVIPQKFILDENVYAFGNVQGERSLCLDTLQRHENKGTINLGVYYCQNPGSAAQIFSISRQKEFRRESTCVDVGDSLGQGKYSVVLKECDEDNIIQFNHPKGGGLLKHISRELCVDVDGIDASGDVFFTHCNSTKPSQIWKIANYYNTPEN